MNYDGDERTRNRPIKTSQPWMKNRNLFKSWLLICMKTKDFFKSFRRKRALFEITNVLKKGGIGMNQ